MKDTRIVCDFCKKDLTCTYNCIDYRIAVKNEEKELAKVPAHTTLGIYPKLENDLYFCDLGCMKNWIMENVK